jgi:hypothetical protein
MTLPHMFKLSSDKRHVVLDEKFEKYVVMAGTVDKKGRQVKEICFQKDDVSKFFDERPWTCVTLPT